MHKNSHTRQNNIITIKELNGKREEMRCEALSKMKIWLFPAKLLMLSWKVNAFAYRFRYTYHLNRNELSPRNKKTQIVRFNLGARVVGRDKSSRNVKCSNSSRLRLASTKPIASHPISDSSEALAPAPSRQNTSEYTVFPFILKVKSKFSFEFTNNQIGEWVYALNSWRTIKVFQPNFHVYTHKNEHRQIAHFKRLSWFVGKQQNAAFISQYFSHRRPKIHFNMLWLAVDGVRT